MLSIFLNTLYQVSVRFKRILPIHPLEDNNANVTNKTWQKLQDGNMT